MYFGMICLIEKIIRGQGVTISYLSCIRKEPGAFASGFFDGREESIFLTEKAGGGTLNEIRWFV